MPFETWIGRLWIEEMQWVSSNIFKQRVLQLFQIIQVGKEMYFLVSYVELFWLKKFVICFKIERPFYFWKACKWPRSLFWWNLESKVRRPVPGPASCLRASRVQVLRLRGTVMAISGAAEIAFCGEVNGTICNKRVSQLLGFLTKWSLLPLFLIYNKSLLWPPPLASHHFYLYYIWTWLIQWLSYPCSLRFSDKITRAEWLCFKVVGERQDVLDHNYFCW